MLTELIGPDDPRLRDADALLVAALPTSAWRASDEVTKAHGCVLAAYDDGAMVGALVAWLVVDEAHLLSVGVAADHRRAGVGTRLLEALRHHAAAKGCVKMLLEVSSTNSAAIALYERRGFEVVHTRAGYYADGSDGVEMLWTW